MIVSQIEQVLVLPITFLGGVDIVIIGFGGIGGIFGSIGGGVNSMTSHIILGVHARHSQ